LHALLERRGVAGHERVGLLERETDGIVAAAERIVARGLVAAELNDKPRKRLGFKKPIEEIGPLLLR